MTRRGGREASERRSEIGEDERQPVIARPAALWRRSNLVILVTLSLGWRLACWGSTEKNEASCLLGLREKHQYSDQRFNRNRDPCVASTAVGTEGEEDQMARRQRKESS